MLPDFIQANTSGRLHDAREPSVSALDRGFLYGDAVYEVWRTYQGVLFAFEDHWARLGRSAMALGIGLPFGADGVFSEIRRTVRAHGDVTGWKGPWYIRLQLTRGGGPIGLDPGLAGDPLFVVIVRALKDPPLDALPAQVLAVARNLRRNHPRTLNPVWKTGNYLNNLLGLAEARQKGADEVVMTNLDGEISEGAVCSLFFSNGDKICTPPLAAGILEGITRRRLIDVVAPAAGLSVTETSLREEDLRGFDGAFTASTTRDVQPVSRIDDHVFDDGPDSVPRRLKRAFVDHARAYAADHPEFSVL